MCVRSAECASAVYRSRHSKPPVQLTVQFNREVGRNPEDGQTEAGYATFCTGGKRHGPDAHQPGFIDTRGAVDNPSPESANLKQYRSGHDGTALDNPRLTML